MPTILARIALVVAALLSASASSQAQDASKATASASEANPALPAPGHSIHGEAFNEGPRSQACLMPGQGKIHFPVTLQRVEAQKFIDQGVGQLHSFFFFESERSFRQAAKIDPTCAMAYWGMAMANVQNPKRARGFLKEARNRGDKVTRREKLYIDALEAFHKEPGNDKDRRKNFLLGLETIVQEYPDDPDARSWLAMVTWQNSDKDGIGSRQAVDTLIETVLQNEPLHPGAHHYRIHLWDSSKPRRAEHSAELYPRSAPGIAHAWHMPGHTYTGLKRYAEAAYQQEGSARVDHAYMIRDRIMPFEIHNYAHNNQWLCTSYSHIGRVRDAIAVARNLVEQPRDPQRNNVNDGGSAQRSGRIRWAEVLTRYELWDDLIEAATSGALDWSDIPIERMQKAYTLGQAYAARNDQKKLAEQIETLRKNSAPDAKASLAELEGYSLLAQGTIGAAFDQFAKASSMRTEALARAHLAARNYGFAESVARRAVEQNPDQVPPLAALVEILHACGNDKDAVDTYRRLEPLAKWADRDVPVLRRLEPIVSRWNEAKVWTTATGTSAPSIANEKSDVDRVDLHTLGPLVWSPFPARPLSGTDTSGKSWTIADLKLRGKNVLVFFFLGGKCPHCMQQLQLFGQDFAALHALNVETIAVSTDDAEATRRLKNNPDGVKFPMTMLADPRLEHFKRYGAFDEFEDQPLHGCFLIDADGDVRYQRISADPFLEVEFIKTEAARVSSLLARKYNNAGG
jgi:peroxiredoxin/tetratricopeptide (TPR) repeat protein